MTRFGRDEDGNPTFWGGRPDRPMYWDRQGKPIADALTWGRMHGNSEYRRVAETTIGPAWISTVWLGIDHRFGEGPPLIFETMIFVRPDCPVHPELEHWDNECWRYTTEAEAIAGHDKVCVDVRVLLENIRMADEVLNEAIETVERSKGQR